MAKLFEINWKIIKKMVRGEKVEVCPIKGVKKEANQWVSREAYKEFGYKAVLAVKRVVEKQRNRLPEEIFQSIKKMALEILESGDKRDDEDIAIDLMGYMSFDDMPLKGVENAVKSARRELEMKKKKKEKKEKIWEKVLEVVEKEPTRNFELNPLVVEGFRVPHKMIVKARMELRKKQKNKYKAA